MPPYPVLLMVRELGIGGCERDVSRIAKALDRSRFEPHVGCFHDTGLRASELRLAGIPIVRFPVRSFRSWSAVRGAFLLGRYLREHRIRLVHPFDTPTVVFGVPAARAFGAPAVVASNLWYRHLYPASYRFLLRVTDRMADRIVVNSKAVQKYLVEEERVPASLTYLCYNGVDTSVFYPQPGPRPAVVQDASLVIGCACALRPEKRLDLLLEAFARVRHLQPGMKLLIVGSGPELEALEEQRRRLDLQESCVLQPARKEIASWMRAMDIFVLPSSSESFPNSLLEAMACGCCVVASRVGGIPELVTHEWDGLLFPSGDAPALAHSLALLIQDGALRERFGRAAAVTARERFSVEINVRRTQELYESLLM